MRGEEEGATVLYGLRNKRRRGRVEERRVLHGARAGE